MFEWVSTFILSGATVAGIEYLGNLVNPKAAGIISGIPISIPSTLLIVGREKQKEFIWSAFLMVCLLNIVTGLCAYLIIHLNMKTVAAVIVSFLSWVIGAIIYYFYFIKN